MAEPKDPRKDANLPSRDRSDRQERTDRVESEKQAQQQKQAHQPYQAGQYSRDEDARKQAIDQVDRDQIGQEQSQFEQNKNEDQSKVCRYKSLVSGQIIGGKLLEDDAIIELTENEADVQRKGGICLQRVNEKGEPDPEPTRRTRIEAPRMPEPDSNEEYSRDRA